MENTNDKIAELSEKIDNLENKIDQLIHIINNMKNNRISNKKVLPDYTPSIHFWDWIKTFIIKREHLITIFETSILDGFKECLEFNISNTLPDNYPIWVSDTSVKKTYIFEEDEWRQFSSEEIHNIIEIIWRKMLEFYFMGEKTEESEEQRDINKKKLIDLRKKLVDKHIKNINKYLIIKFNIG